MAQRAPEAATVAAVTGAEGARLLIIEARFYEAIADSLAAGAVAAIEAAGATCERIAVPGALEIPQALLACCRAGKAGTAARTAGRFDGAIALGCVIRGETSHYDIVCNTANHWLMQVATTHGVPVGNGILTVENDAQAWARAAAGPGNKGADAARACLALIALSRQLAAGA